MRVERISAAEIYVRVGGARGANGDVGTTTITTSTASHHIHQHWQQSTWDSLLRMEMYGARAHFMGPMLWTPGNLVSVIRWRWWWRWRCRILGESASLGDGGMNKFRLSRTHMYLQLDAREFAANMMNASMRVNEARIHWRRKHTHL